MDVLEYNSFVCRLELRETTTFFKQAYLEDYQTQFPKGHHQRMDKVSNCLIVFDP